MLRLLSIGGACLALAFAAGCGDDDEDDASAGGGGTSGGAYNAAPAETQASSDSTDEIVVTMKGFAFAPAEVDAKVGQVVRWVNEDDAPHNAVSESGPEIKTDTFEKGGEATVTLDSAGTIKYICTVHPKMTGTITVTE